MKRVTLAVLFAWLLVSLLPAAVTAQPKPLVIILLPKTSLTQWRQADAPNLHRLMQTGALAVMNTRTARMASDRARETPESAALTLGAGSRAAANAETAAFQWQSDIIPAIGVRAADLYTRRMGIPAPPGALVDIAWPQLLRDNKGHGYDIHPGNLADALAAQRITVSANGALAPLVAAQGNGTEGIDPNADCRIIDAGSDIRAADLQIGQAAAEMAALHGELIVVSPCVDDTDYAQGRRLAPILAWGANVPAGLLYSPSTRRAGLVTNTDFAPSVAAYFGLPQSAMPTRPFGSAWRAVAAGNNVNIAAHLEAEAYRQQRGQKMLPYLAVALGLWLILASALFKIKHAKPWRALLPPVLIFALLISASAGALCLWLIALSIAAGIVSRRYGVGQTILMLSFLIVLLIIGDIFVGSPLMQRCLLGYSAVEGARYYGLGNEAMGALLGAALIAIAMHWPRLGAAGKRILMLALAALVLILVAPFAGAKAGGALTAIPAFGTLLALLSGKRLRGRFALGLFLAALLSLGVIALWDSRGTAGQSHIGAAAGRIISGGAAQALDIISRKWAVELRLAYHSAWAVALWGMVAAFWMLFPLWHRSETRALMVAGAVAVGTCLLFNDAGVVAASLCGALVWSALAIQTQENRPAPVTRA